MPSPVFLQVVREVGGCLFRRPYYFQWKSEPEPFFSPMVTEPNIGPNRHKPHNIPFILMAFFRGKKKENQLYYKSFSASAAFSRYDISKHQMARFAVRQRTRTLFLNELLVSLITSHIPFVLLVKLLTTR